MTERIRINRIELGQTLKGKAVAHLHAPGAQFAKYPVLVLRDPSLLISVGIDPNGLTEDKPVHVSLWAHYEVSTKKNSEGNYYKNVVSLERIDAPATTTSTDTSAILGELRAIKALLLDMATDSQPPAAAAAAERVRKLRNVVGSAKDPQATTEQEPELTEAEARTAFYELTGPAVIAGTDPQAINDLTALANGEGWDKALASLKALLAT